MSSKRPRTTLLLTDELLSALRSLSDASGMSMSSIVVKFLEPSIPVMKSLENAFSTAQDSSVDSIQILAADIVDLIDKSVDQFNKEIDND